MQKNNQVIDRILKAEQHTVEAEQRYALEIEKSIQETIFYDSDHVFYKKLSQESPSVVFKNTDTVSALRDERENNNKAKIAVLNFASFKNAGGGFIDGLMAQEESLCHESFLYNVLREFEKTYYKANRKGMKYGLYSNKALYSPGILFYKDGREIVSANVITCAAPNKSAACRYHKIPASENSEVLKSRVKYIKSIAEEQEVEIIILGAFGAGVFGQDPVEVAELMRDIFSKTTINRVVYAVPGEDKNARAFKDYFGEI